MHATKLYESVKQPIYCNNDEIFLVKHRLCSSFHLFLTPVSIIMFTISNNNEKRLPFFLNFTLSSKTYLHQ